MRYLTRQQMQSLDQKAIRQYKIPALVLMENAGRAVAQEASGMMRRPKQGYVTILCGSGNNGGDGLVTARHLFNQGHKVKIIYLGKIKQALGRGEAGINLAIALKMGLAIKEVPRLTPSASKVIFRVIRASQLVIDAIFGTGLTRPLSAEMQDLINQINRLKRPVLAIDVPSGLDCNNGIALGAAIKATKTVTLAAPKIGFLKKSARQYLGKLVIADIGIPCFLLS